MNTCETLLHAPILLNKLEKTTTKYTNARPKDKKKKKQKKKRETSYTTQSAISIDTCGGDHE